MHRCLIFKTAICWQRVAEKWNVHWCLIDVRNEQIVLQPLSISVRSTGFLSSNERSISILWNGSTFSFYVHRMMRRLKFIIVIQCHMICHTMHVRLSHIIINRKSTKLLKYISRLQFAACVRVCACGKCVKCARYMTIDGRKSGWQKSPLILLFFIRY